MTTTAGAGAGDIDAALGAYLPRGHRRLLAGRRAGDPAAAREPIAGAAIFVDVAGFSRLTEQLAQQGPAGAEILSGMLNAHFSRFTALVEEHGGDVQYFAGDAALAIWPAAPGGLGDAVRAATRCALALRDALHGAEPLPGFTLRLRAGVGAGPMTQFALGGYRGAWLGLVVGDAIRQSGWASGVVPPGEIAVSPDALSAAGDGIQGSTDSTGLLHVTRTDGSPSIDTTSPASPQVEPSLLRASVPDVVRERLEAGHAEWLAEFRRVSMVFVNLRTPPEDLGSARDVLQQLVERAQRTVAHYEGTLYQVLQDDKGVSVVAAFGLPPFGGERAAVRAVDAGKALHREFTALSFGPSVGVATGRSFCGACGGATRRQYTVVGSTINLAARLMQLAEGGVVCDDATRQDVGALASFETLPPARVKGWEEPVDLFAPRSRGDVAPPQRQGRFIAGRETEQRVLGGMLDGLREGRGGLVWIEGEAGIGKSHLLGDTMARAAASGVRVLAGTGDSVERTTTYFAWRDVLLRLLDADRSTPLDRLRAAVQRELAGDAESLDRLALLNPLLRADFPESDATRPLQAQARADGAESLTVHLFQRAARRAPLLLVLDDMHWLESTSLDLASAVARRVPEVMVVLASRPLEEPRATSVRRLVEATGGRLLPLGPLGVDDLPALLAHRLGIRDLPPELVAFVLDRAEGHPFHSEELVLSMRDRELIRIEDGICRLTDPAALQAAAFPDSVHGVVSSRIDRLDVDEQLMLKAASVIGRVFELDLLQDIYPVPADLPRLRPGLERLAAVDLTQVEAPDPHPAWQFRHAIVQDVAYESLPFGQRRQLHRAVAEWYETHRPEDMAALAPLLAHHWDRAQEPARAVPYLELAGRRAVESFANREAIGFLGRAVEIVETGAVEVDDDRRCGWEMDMGDASIFITDYDAALRHFGNALRLLGYAMPPGRGRMVLGTLAEVVRQVVHRLRADGAVEVHDERLRTRLARASNASKRYGEAGWFNDEQLVPVYGSIRCLNFAERAGERSYLVDAYATMAVIAAMAGLRSLGGRYIERSRALRDAGAGLRDSARIQLNYACNVGRWDLVHEATDLGCEEYGRLGARFLWETCRAGRGFCDLLTGDYENALRAFEETFESARYGALQSRLWARAGQCATLLARDGAVPEALLADYRLQIRYNTYRSDTTVAHGLLALAALRAGDAATALDLARTAIGSLLASPPNLYYAMWSISGCCEVALSIAASTDSSDTRHAEARQLAAQGCGILQRMSWIIPIIGSRASLHRGQLAALRRRPRRARRFWTATIESARRYGMPLEEGLGHLALAEFQARAGEDASAALAAATTTFSRIGAQYELARTRQLAGTLHASPSIPGAR